MIGPLGVGSTLPSGLGEYGGNRRNMLNSSPVHRLWENADKEKNVYVQID